MISYWVSLLNTVKPLLLLALLLLSFTLASNFLLEKIRKNLVKALKSKKYISNVEILSRVLKSLMFIFIVFFAISFYTGSLAGFGAGLISAALGWALQKPITGIAGWIMIVIKRPFEVGERVVIGDVKEILLI